MFTKVENVFCFYRIFRKFITLKKINVPNYIYLLSEQRYKFINFINIFLINWKINNKNIYHDFVETSVRVLAQRTPNHRSNITILLYMSHIIIPQLF